MRLDVSQMFRDMGLEGQVYVLVFVAMMFSGSLYGRFFPYLIVLEVALMLWMSATMPRKRASAYLTGRGSTQVGILLIFCLFLTWQMSVAFAPEITAIYVRRFLLFAVLLVLVPRPDVCVCAIKASKYYALIVSLSIIVTALITGSRTGGLVGDYQFAGMMMSIACILFVIDYFYQGARRVDIVGFTLALTALFISGKRMFAVLAVLGFVALYLLSRRERNSIKVARLLLAVAAVLGPMYLFFEPVRQLVVRMGLLSLDEYAATSGRNLLWGAAVDVFRSHSVVGIGFGNFPVFLAQNMAIRGAGEYLAHNIYYGLLAETGIIGFGLVVGLMAITLMQSWRLHQSVRRLDDGRFQYVMVFSLAVQAWFILYGFTGNGIYDWHEFFFYISAIAMMVSVRRAIVVKIRSAVAPACPQGDRL